MSEFTEKAIRDAFPEAVLETTTDSQGALNVKLDPGSLLGVCEKLHSDAGLAFDYLEDVTAIDWTDRFEVVYRLRALASNQKLVLRVDLDHEKPEVNTVTSVWRGANYQEREVYDLMGVKFAGHPDLRRILLPEDWEGHPLRKDYVIPD